MKAYLFGLSMMVCGILSAQKNMPIYFDFCNYYWKQPVVNDTTVIDVRYNDNICRLKIYMTNWKGTMNFRLMHKNDVLILEGKYINSLGILRNYITVRTNGLEGNSKVEIINFYRPLRNGLWRYYKDNQIEKEEKYLNGILIE